MNPRNDGPPGPETSKETPLGIYVDAEGDWYHDGSMILRENIIEIFVAGLNLEPSGKYTVQCNQDRYELEAADTPFVVSRVDRVATADPETEEIVLRFKHLTGSEPLDPSTLRVGKENVLYCTVRNGHFPARFSRPAYYQLAQWIEEDPETERFYLDLNGIRHFIAGVRSEPLEIT